MIPQNFEYAAPGSLKEALALLSNGEARVLAGGMSLIPMMKLRLAAPEKLIDLGRVPGLSGITEEAGSIRIGAMTTHHEIEDSALLRAKCPLLAEAAANIGDVQVRNMGTIGGSVAHADPAADYPASLLALEAKVRLVSNGSERTLSLEEFLVDTMTTAIEPGEILQEVIVPVENPAVGVNYQKMVQPASGFAIVGVAARVAKTNGKPVFVRVGVTGLAGKAYRASGVEKVLLETGDVMKAAAVVANGVDANSDLFASADYRKHMAQVYTARALTQALAGAA
ncbi:MAG TPA: xanthine dehydrogenase family protein subunit M [Bryobacteraceae bacterium]|nr:xanthine dehydrogenase family protein subunit M [Bryobacteraceae bacterium]